MSQDEFFSKLKRRWLEKTVFTRNLEKFSVTVGQTPPIMAPTLIGTQLFNTEAEKRSVYLKENSIPDGK